ncbi:MAG: hypothetical protein AABW71_03735 [Nanoarchaeota archaeon]
MNMKISIFNNLIYTTKLRARRNMLANSNNLLDSSSKLCKAQHVRKSKDLLTLAIGRGN